MIWIHGLGADAHDFYDLPPLLDLPDAPAIRHIFPNAPRIPVTLNQGLVMPAWYDLSASGARDEDAPRIRASAGWIGELIAREVERGVPARRIVLAGFSQGGAMALFTGLRHPQALAGICCLSGYLLLPDALVREASAANWTVPILQAHGTTDPMVPPALAAAGRDRLVEAGYAVDWREYPMGHQICLDQVRDLGAWLTRVLTAPAPADGAAST